MTAWSANVSSNENLVGAVRLSGVATDRDVPDRLAVT